MISEWFGRTIRFLSNFSLWFLKFSLLDVDDDLLNLKEKVILLTRKFTEFHVRLQTHLEARIALANIGAYAFSTSWTAMQVLAVKLRAILPSPTAITKTHGTNAVTIVKTTIWAAHYWNRYKKRNVKFLKHTIRYFLISHNAPYLLNKMLRKYCFQFLFGRL